MVEQMAMERPIADCIGGEIEARGAPRLDKPRMLARRAIALPRDQFEKMTVKVTRMAHHRIVDEIDPNALAFDEGDRLVLLGHVAAVERQHDALPNSGQNEVQT